MTSIGNINAFSYNNSSKLYVPVTKRALIYSHFDHVSGVAAKSGQQGVSISKIRILNSLIERISTLKNQPKESFTDISDSQADTLIKNYQNQIKQALSQNNFIFAGAKPQIGTLFAIDV